MAATDIGKPYILYTDACDYSIGGILVQVDSSGIEKIIQYVSKALDKTQCKWPVIENEAFAVIYCLRKLTTYLVGATFIVYTEHKPIISLFTREMNNIKIQRWAIEFEEFDCEIRYIKGSENVRAGFMSRIEPTVDTAVLVEVEGKVVSALIDNNPKFKDLHFEVIGTEQRIEFPGE